MAPDTSPDIVPDPSQPPPSRPTHPLFRAQALSSRYDTRQAPPLQLTSAIPSLISVMAIVVTLAILGIAAFGSVTPTAVVTGRLTFHQGPISIMAPSAALVSRVAVSAGQAVATGRELVQLTTSNPSHNSDVIASAKIRADKASLHSARLVQQEIALLLSAQMTSGQDGTSALKQQETILGLEQRAADAEREAALAEVALQQDSPTDQLVLRAPSPGIVSNLLAPEGGSVSQGAALLTIVPTRGRLDGVAFVPARVIDDLKPNQAVEIRYDDFPYRQYGSFQGTMGAIPSVPMERADLALEGLADRSAADLFRVVVSIDQQAVPAGDQVHPLRSGMRFSIVIIQPRISLWRLVFGTQRNRPAAR